ncbi:MAG: DUF2141 domain-containing protein [Erythrobacter sp.]|uniref:DUF2141 domain-containing protein n=1 Tax=Erythrobacter sp. TaxID=1042 RepID=UPI0026220DAE|nr:DUF2141 domain-containing protein [Erythrobacter sp.]MDJ0979175.1 DUF2141 domain-containing protein [Erythrobacter sp.]
MGLLTIAKPALVAAAAICSTGVGAQNPETGQPLKLSFGNIDPEEGEISVSVCTEPQLEERYSGGSSDCLASARVPAKEGAQVVFDDLPPGIYAVTAYHDEDTSGALDFDTRGIPFEATGNAHGARGSFGPPTFDQMKITIAPASDGAGTLTYRIRMFRYDF